MGTHPPKRMTTSRSNHGSNSCLACGNATGNVQWYYCKPCRSKGKNGDEGLTVDAVNHPKHYTNNPKGIELIDMIGHLSFPKGAAIKYIYRAGEKDPNKAVEDLKKAKWFIDHMINDLEKKDGI